MKEHSVPLDTEDAAGSALEERLRRAQDLVAKHVEPRAMLSQELIAERRAAAMEE